MTLLDLLPADERRKARRAALPDWTEPMLATLTEERFSDPDWIFERKFDGIRCLAFVRRGQVRLLTRNQLSANDRYPEIVDALTGQERSAFIVDGEAVAFRGSESGFALLQHRGHAPARGHDGVRIFFQVFDVLHADGWDVTRVGLLHRKALLRELLDYRGALRYTTHRVGAGERYTREACEKGWEGIIGKLATSPYEHGRSPAWRKFKCTLEQELVIGGYTEPQGSRSGFGALLVGHYRGRDLVYAGKVGTGFDDETLEDLTTRLTALERPTSPFVEEKGLPRKGVHWVQPKLVGQIGFGEWTGDGRLRHPRFLGLRFDKPARSVVRETPAR
jgi:bifunctional non-homologous end joining protein LigD